MPTTYYSCTTLGCSATTTTTMYTTLQQCQDVCTRWGCNANVINEDTNIYVFYDISSMDSSWLQNANQAVNDWVASGIPGFSGNIYHTLDHRERWLSYDYIIYSGNVGGTSHGGESATLFNGQTGDVPIKAFGWKQLEVANGSVWYDMFTTACTQPCSAPTDFPSITIPNSSVYAPYQNDVVTPSGLPPTSLHSDNVLVITFNDESAPGGNGYHSTSLEWDGQPTTPWMQDYDNYTANTWSQVQAANGTLNQFLFVAASGSTSLFAQQTCTPSTPCVTGPMYSAQWQTAGGTFPWANGPDLITGTFPHPNGSGQQIQGCTGIFGTGNITTNPNPCPSTWSDGTLNYFWYNNLNYNTGYAIQFTQQDKSHVMQTLAAISSGNKTNVNGTWTVGSAPLTQYNVNYGANNGPGGWSLCNILDTGYGVVYNANVPNLENENPYWVDSSGDMINLSTTPNPVGPVTNHGALDQLGWGVNVEAKTFNSTNLAAGINSFLAQGFTAQTLCTSAETSNSQNFPYTSWLDCNTIDGCGKYSCGPVGCVPNGFGVYESLTACTASCFSYECRNSGCTQIVGSGGTHYVSASTQDSLTACTASCITYNCSPTGCFEVVGTGGTFQTQQSCTASCISYACADSGCTTFAGTGNTPYSAQSSCTTACVSWNCTPSGCVERNGTGGTYTELSACTTACKSYGCSDNGCLIQPGTGGTYYDTSSLQDSLTACTASCTSYFCTDTGCTQMVGTGGTHYEASSPQDSLTACTASCISYSCTTTGCDSQAGSGGTYWNSVNPATALANCNVNCTSYNCTPTGCVIQTGTGGHYPNYNACSAACYSYRCTSTGCQISGGTGSTYASLGACNTICKSWDCESTGCIQQFGTGGTHQIYTNCTSGCTSWDCRASGCTEVGGTGGTLNFYDCTGTCSSYTCTDTGCTIQQGSGGTYYDTGSIQDALTACTATCRSWYCDTTGCVARFGVGGTFSSLADCLTGDSVTHISGCTSFECRASGCTEIAGTGATNTTLIYDTCSASCYSFNCMDTGCTQQVGSGGTFQDNTSCQSFCKSWYCDDNGCTQQYGTGGTFNDSVLCATNCISYYCDINGCQSQGGTGGTFTDLNDCSSACTSFECRDSGCTEIAGTGSTNALSACTASCQSYNCSHTGCVIISGSGGTFYNSASLQDSLTACTASCSSWFCTVTGCTEQTGTGGTYSALTSCTATCSSWNCSPTGCTQLVGTGGTFTEEIDCTTGCTSYNCTDAGCVERVGTGGTYTTSAACTASCVSYGCSDAGCAQEIGSGATHFDPDSAQDALTACTATCISWNCTDSGCTEVIGTGGTYSTQAHCLTACTSWFCTVTGCTEQVGSGGTYANSGLCATDGACVSYYCMDTGCTQVQGSGGTISSSGTCTAACTSWVCTPTGCTEQQGTGGTYSIQAHCTTACTSFFCTDSGCTEQSGTGGTFSTSATCTASCTSFYCTPIGCTEQTGTGGTFSTTGTCTASCQSYNCSDNGCVVQNGTGGTYYRSSSLQDSLTACTASCYSYQCTDTGCDKVTGSGGTHYNIAYPWHAQTACTASCVSWDCGPSGVITGPNNSACIEQVGTGSTWVIEQDCVLNCQSWNCGDTGCEYAAGSGGTWYYLNDPSLSQTNCATHCWSYWCDTIGCQDEPGSGQTFYVANSADILFDNVYRAQTACTEECQSWTCTTQSGLVGPTGQPTGCLQIPGTGATNTDVDFNDCYIDCTSYDCGAQGCYLAVGGGGQYFDIAICEAACMSWQCTDTGCELLEGNTGTTTQPPCDVDCVSWDCTDTGCLQRPGLGGQHTSLNDCNNNCESWYCNNTSCLQQQGTGATFSSLNSCTTDCQSWNCENFGCSSQVGTGATHTTEAICSTACTSWECNGTNNPPVNGNVLGCYELSGTGWTHSSQVDCTGSCTTYECEAYPTGCVAYPGLTGSPLPLPMCDTLCKVWFCGGLDDLDQGCYSRPGNPSIVNGGFQFSNELQCLDACKSYDCLSTGCTEYPETGHTYSDAASCAAVCFSYSCLGVGPSYGCQQQPHTGGTWSAITDCDCFSWDCGPSGCVAIPGAGGAYSSSTDCDEACISYNCSDDGCVALTGNSGTYPTATACRLDCKSYVCTDSGCTETAGTGSTFLTLVDCTTGCTSWQCLDGIKTGVGCTEFPGTGSTYAYEHQCSGGCVSWECTSAFVLKHQGTGYTFDSYPSATAACQSFECFSTYLGNAIDGCAVQNPAPSSFTGDDGWWGTGGTYDSMSACTGGCVHWGCNQIAITQFAKLYVYYDITSMGVKVLEEAYDRITDWVSSIPGWSGETNHVLTQGHERWLAWPVMSYSGRSIEWGSNHTPVTPVVDPLQLTISEFPFGSTSNNKIAKLLYWAENTPDGIAGNWYDQGITGTCSPPQTFDFTSGYLNGVNVTGFIGCYKGMPPTADLEDDVVNVVFLDEANSAYHSFTWAGPFTSTSGYPTFWPQQTLGGNWDDIDYSPSQFNGKWPNLTPQPTFEFDYDYDRYQEIWNAVTGTTSGSVRSFFYPRPKQGIWRHYHQELALNAFASIHSGNQDDTIAGGTGIQDGTWIPGTAPFNGGTGQGPAFPYYSRADLSILEVRNPYTKNYSGVHYNYTDPTYTGLPNNIAWSSETQTGGRGHLDRFGWGINISLGAFYSQTFYDDMNNFLNASTSVNFVIGCVSAETQQTLQYPYDSASGCSSGCTGLSCSDYGCVLGVVDQFTSSVNCSAACQSYNCTVNGCEWQYGTGGTYYNATDGTYGLADCQAVCGSWNCVDILSLANSTDQGCQMIIGTGGTFQAYTSCTASCQSWNCECDCDYPTPLTACTNIPNSGGTYSALTSCTATCTTGASWYCSGETVDASGVVLTPCYVFCGVGGYYADGVTPIPMSLVYGPYSTSGAAQVVCCESAVTWDCTGQTIQNSCLNRTLLPGTHISGGEAMQWLTTYLPSQTITDFSYESTVQTYGTQNECQGPNGGVMYELNGLAHPNINGGAFYSNWNTFITACISAGVPLITTGMVFNQANAYLNSYYGDFITIFEEPCFCDQSDCGCEPNYNGTGQYTAQTACTASCCTAATTWNCVQDPYKPICNTKPILGVFGTASVVLDNFRQFDPTGIFALSKFYPWFNTVGTPVNVPWATVYANTIALGALNYYDCYKKVPDPSVPGAATFLPATYVESVSHPMISGGTPFHTWQTFLDAVIAAGVTGVSNSTPIASLCSQIHYQLHPWTWAFSCNITTKECCSPEHCYCYELFQPTGTYQTEIDCIDVCCPIGTGYTCDSVFQCVGPIPYSSIYTSWFTGLNAQNDCLAYCSGDTTWNCVPASVTGTCDDAQYGEYPPNSIAFQSSTIAYPFMSASVASPSNTLGMVEKVLTNNTYFNPNWAFSSVTWELGINIPQPINICVGANGKPLYRIMCLGSTNVDNGTMYYSWASFISAAVTAGFTVSVGQDISMLQAPVGPFKFQVKSQACVCGKMPCHCVEVLGTGGVFSTEILCLDVCCSVDSWNCTINGCEDPGNGTGTYLSLPDCQAVCKEWLCGPFIPPNHVDGKTATGIVGSLIDQITWLAVNTPPTSPFSDYRYEDNNYPLGMTCVGNSGYPWRFVTNILVPSLSGSLIVTPPLSSWGSFIDYLNLTYPSLPVNVGQSFPIVNDTIQTNNNGYGIKIQTNTCVCNTLDCACHIEPGTGHTNGYHLSDYAGCEFVCCSGVCIDDCSVLLVGHMHGVSTYDVVTNQAIHLFDVGNPGTPSNPNEYEEFDVAAGHHKIWVMEGNQQNSRIMEYNILSMCPFQAVYSRTINTGVRLGYGLAPTASANGLIVNSGGKVVHIDITNNVLPPSAVTVLLNLPTYTGGPISNPLIIQPVLNVGYQYSVTGDILYDWNAQTMLILYGTCDVSGGNKSADMWIGEFDVTSGAQLQAFHITAGFNSPMHYYSGLFENSVSGRKYVVSNHGQVDEVIMSPLSIAPLNQDIPNYHVHAFLGGPLDVLVAGGTNIVTSVSDCISLFAPISYNCKISGGGCTDPKDGTGKYSRFNGAESDEDALAKCNAACISNTWNCSSTPQKTDAKTETGYELPGSITNEISAYDYISLTPSLHDVPLNQIYFQNVGVTTVDSNISNTNLANQTCWPKYSKGWKYSLDSIEIIKSKIISTTWGGLISNLKSSGVDVNHSSKRSEVFKKSNEYFDTTIPFTQNSKARTCFMATCECVEVIGSGGYYSTSGNCIDACCPTYTCTKNGCIDPLDGSGSFKGVSGLTECQNECKELLCVSSQAITDDCTGKITPTFNYTPYDTSFWTVLSWFADPTNKSQRTNFIGYKWIKQVPSSISLPGHCDNTMLKSPSGFESFWYYYTGTFTWMKDVSIGWPFSTTVAVSTSTFYANNWYDIIGYAQVNGCPTVNLSMTFQQVQTEMKDVCGVSFAWSDDYCRCTYTDCGCQEVLGTGHTGAYQYWEQTECDDKCCPNAIVINQSEMGLIDELDKIIYEPKETITVNTDSAVVRLNTLREGGETGDDCKYCNNNNGVCLYDGCLSYTDLPEFGATQLTWMFDSSGPQGPSYDCFSTGCYLVWDGSPAQFNGGNALSNCQEACTSYNCVPGNVSDDCEELIKLEVKGDAATAMSFIADKNNGYQTSKLSNFKYEEVVSEKPKDSCTTPDGNVFSKLSSIKATDFYGEKTIVNNTNTWSTFISELSKTGYPVTDEMSYNSVVQTGAEGAQKFKIKINKEYCSCVGLPCHCTSVVGTGGTGTYPNLTLCNQAASTNPCCTTDVNSYNCTVNGCSQHIGVGLGTYNSAYALYECEQDCVAWGCHDAQLTLTSANTIVTPQSVTALTTTTGMSSADTVIHVWYDTSSMGTALLNQAQNAVNQWVTTAQQPGGMLDGWMGLIAHDMTSAEDWIRWPKYSMDQWSNTTYKNLIVVCLIDEANFVYPQNDQNSYTPGAPPVLVGCAEITYDKSCSWNQPWTSYSGITVFPDGCSTIDGQMPTQAHVNTYISRPNTTGGPNSGPTILKVLSVGAQNTLLQGNAYNSTTCSPNPTGGTSVVTQYTSQGKVPPVHNWYTHKSEFITKYTDWINNGGTIQTLVYAASPNIGNSGSTGVQANQRDFIRHLFASINGSDVHATNGTWTLDPLTQNPLTTNGTPIFGGPAQTQLYGTNEFIDLNWAVTTENGYRNDVPLTSYGVHGIYNRRGVGAFTPQALGNDIEQFISTYPITTTNIITTTIYNSATTYTSSVYTVTGQCLSAQTTLNTAYPFTSQLLCDTQNCVADGWNCGINGCYSQPGGQYLTFTDCDESCYSYSCDTKVTGLIQEGTAILGTYCQEFDSNGNGTKIPLTGNGYDALSYYLDSIPNGYVFGFSGYGETTWFVSLFDNTGNNTGGVQTTVYPAIISGVSTTSGTTGLIVEDDGLGNCETPGGGRLCRFDRVQLIDTSTGVIFYDVHSETLEHFIQTMIGNSSYTNIGGIPGFPSGVPGVYQGITLFNLIQIGYTNTVRQFTIKIFIKGCPCSHSCDCIKLVGTGQTGTYYSATNQLTAYHDCVDNCCASLKTWTCPTNANTAAVSGCIDPLDGSGAYTTKALCDADCTVTWNCATAANTNNCPNVNTYIPFTLSQAYFTNQDPGFMMASSSGPIPLATTYGPGGVNSDIEALMYIFDQDKGLHNTQLNNIGYARGQTYLTTNQQCDYPNGGGRKLGVMEYFYQNDLSTYYCMEYEMRVNGVPFMPWSTTASTQSAYNRCHPSTSNQTNTSTIPETKYTSVKQMLDVIEWMYSQPEINVLGQVLKAGPCNGNSKQFSSLFNPGPNTAACNPSKPVASNGFKSNLSLKDFWEAGLFRPHYGYGVMATTPVNNWASSWGTGVSPDGTNIQYGINQMPIVLGRDLIVNTGLAYNSTECQCVTSCGCQPVLGTSGMYPTNISCQVVCCPNDVCTICCRDIAGTVFTTQQIGLNCVCPPTTHQVQCSTIPNIQSCKVGQTWSTDLKQCVADTSLPCMIQHCPSGYLWDALTCDCLLCTAQECGSDKIWNSSTCKCDSVSLPCPEETCGTNYIWDTASCSCVCVTQSCTDGYAWNSSTCQCDAVAGEVVYGCTDPTATNYNSLANTNDGTCTYPSDEESGERAENQPHISGLVLNELTHEYARGCVESDVEVVETYGTYDTLKDCLNSGVAGTWTVTKDVDSRETFGFVGRVDTYTQIPMCCSQWINRMTTDETTLDYKVCNDWCISQSVGHGGNYLPLYNVVGPNTTDEESTLVFYQNIRFINHVHTGMVIINSESEHEALPTIYE